MVCILRGRGGVTLGVLLTKTKGDAGQKVQTHHLQPYNRTHPFYYLRTFSFFLPRCNSDPGPPSSFPPLPTNILKYTSIAAGVTKQLPPPPPHQYTQVHFYRDKASPLLVDSHRTATDGGETKITKTKTEQTYH